MGDRVQMNMCFQLYLLGLITSVAIADHVIAPINQKMHEGMTRSACTLCHTTPKDRPKLHHLGQCCNQNCLRCHFDMTQHHPVGADITIQPGIKLPLLTGEKLACISCHDVFSARTDTQSWKSQSLFAKWFQTKTIYKTYYLRINNSDGKLCKMCH